MYAVDIITVISRVYHRKEGEYQALYTAVQTYCG